MNQKEKLLVVMEHWIEHNEAHLDEYRKWAQTATELGLDSVTSSIETAIKEISDSNRHLKEALKAVHPVKD